MQPDDLTYHQWLKCFTGNLFSVGAKGIFFIFAIIPGTFFLAIKGVNIFPAGEYPRLVLALPGLLMAGIYVYALGAFIHQLSTEAAIFVSVIICALWVGVIYFFTLPS